MKKDLAIAVVTFVVIAGICYALATMRPLSPPAPSAAAGTTKGSAAGSEKVVMHVNGEPVTEKEFILFLEQAPGDTKAFYETPEGKQALAAELAKLKMLEQEGRRLGVDKDPDVVERINLTRSNIIAGFALRKIVPAPTDARIQQEFEKEKKNFETVDLRHIVVAYQGSRFPARSGAALSAEAAMRKAQALLQRIRGGASFESIAQGESDDQNSAKQGGLIGPVPAGSMPPELDKVAMKLKPGEVSQPVKSDFGIHIFKAGERKSAQMDAQMKQGIASLIQRQDLDRAVGALQKTAKIELDDKYFGVKTLPTPRTTPGLPGPTAIPQRQPGN